MSELTHRFGQLYHPVKALLIYCKQQQDCPDDYYIESYDLDTAGSPINGHPLSLKESRSMAKALQTAERKTQGFLNPKGRMPQNIVYLKTGTDGFAVWHTPARKAALLFTENLHISSGEAHLPAMLWKASRKTLQVFALKGEALEENTLLHHAPFFNVYADGRVCLGNIGIRIPASCALEQFTGLWEDCFFGSYFSHLMPGHLPAKSNLVQLWQELRASGAAFPEQLLIQNGYTLDHLNR